LGRRCRMKFQSSVLVRVTQVAGSDWTCLSPTTSLKAVAPTRQDSLEEMRTKLENLLNTQGAYYINTIGRGPDSICCPEGFLDVRCDLWKCKMDRQICKLQAWIPTSDKEQFVANCHAPDQKREGIYGAVIEREYNGAHHRPGRYLCPTCKPPKKDAFSNYHYPWEVTPLGDFVDTEDHDLRAALIENDVSMAVTNSSLCPDCFIQVISIVSPGLLHELEIIRLSFTNEPCALVESEDSLPKKEKPPLE